MGATTNEQVTEQQAEGGEVEINRGPFNSVEEANAVKPAEAKYKLWQTACPDGQVRYSWAIGSARGTLAVVKGLGFKTSLVGGKKAMVTAADVGNFLANMSEDERAEYLKQYLPKKGGKGK